MSTVAERKGFKVVNSKGYFLTDLEKANLVNLLGSRLEDLADLLYSRSEDFVGDFFEDDYFLLVSVCDRFEALFR